MNTIIYIAGLQRSGTTLLNIILGGHSRLIGVGEVFQLLKCQGEDFYLTEKLDEDCSCGARVRECTFWGEVSRRLHAGSAGALDERYSMVREVFMELFGPDSVMVDSSKSLRYLKLLAGTSDASFSVIHLTKDARAHCISQIDNAKRKGLPANRRNPFVQMRKWYRTNLAFSRFLDAQVPTYFRMGYEELSLYPDKLVPAVTDWLRLDYEPRMLELNPGECHIIHGNRMRGQADKNRKIRYDNRWFFRSEWMLPYMLSARTRRLNTCLVYHNETGNLWNQ